MVSNLQELADRVWWPIAHGSTDFKHYEREAAAIRWLNAKRFAAWIQAHASDRGMQRRQLAVLVYGDHGASSGSSGTHGAASADACGETGRDEIKLASAAEGEQSTTDSDDAIARTWMGMQSEIRDVLAWRRNLPRLHGYFSQAAAKGSGQSKGARSYA